MDVLLLILALVCAIIGIVGSVVPAIPGPVLAYGSLWLAQWSDYVHFSPTFLWVMTAVTAIIFVADYYLPSMITKKMGGSKSAQWGAFIGMLGGVFLTPIGMLLGMLIGAFVGEFMFNKSDTVRSLSAAVGSFLGFLVGTGIKLFLGFYILYEICVQIWSAIF